LLDIKIYEQYFVLFPCIYPIGYVDMQLIIMKIQLKKRNKQKQIKTRNGAWQRLGKSKKFERTKAKKHFKLISLLLPNANTVIPQGKIIKR